MDALRAMSSRRSVSTPAINMMTRFTAGQMAPLRRGLRRFSTTPRAGATQMISETLICLLPSLSMFDQASRRAARACSRSTRSLDGAGTRASAQSSHLCPR